jgi:hypothetical protein
MRWPGVLLIAIGCLNGWLGYLIRFRGYHDLLAGTSRAARAEKAPWVGGWTIVMGLLCILWGLGTVTFAEHAVGLARLMSVLLLLTIAVMFGKAR